MIAPGTHVDVVLSERAFLGTTAEGNTRWTLYTRSGLSYRTAPDSAVGLLVQKREWYGVPVRLYLDERGRVNGMDKR